MRKDAATAIMEEYDKRCTLYSTFTDKIQKLIKELIKENGLRVHSVTSRIKTKASLQAKLTRSARKLLKLSDVTDISGIRIITYFADDVDSIARMVQKEFDVDMKYSVDRRELLDPDRFGYLSLHYVVKLPAARLRLTEYKRFKDCQAEIQIRSILQHAWAEIEHDLGYKGKEAVPREIRRRFSRLAGLLEMADTEFVQIRDSLLQYEKVVPQLIADTPASVLIDKASLSSFVKNSSLVHRIDSGIASVGKSKIVADEKFISELINQLQYVGFKTIADVDSFLHEHEEIFIRFVKFSFERELHESKTLSAGICLWHLCYVRLASKKSTDKMYRYLERFNIGAPAERKPIAQQIISSYIKAAANRG